MAGDENFVTIREVRGKNGVANIRCWITERVA
jgi:hypothetical protein